MQCRSCSAPCPARYRNPIYHESTSSGAVMLWVLPFGFRFPYLRELAGGCVPVVQLDRQLRKPEAET